MVRDSLIYRCWRYRAGVKVGCGIQISAKFLEPFIESALFQYIDSATRANASPPYLARDDLTERQLSYVLDLCEQDLLGLCVEFGTEAHFARQRPQDRF